jgi:hypothetical protein
VWTECLFVDPIADIAILGERDNQVLYEEYQKYLELVDAVEPLAIARAPKKPTAMARRDMGDRRRPWRAGAAVVASAFEGIDFASWRAAKPLISTHSSVEAGISLPSAGLAQLNRRQDSAGPPTS